MSDFNTGTASTGASIGSAFGPVGTAVGAVAGGFLGGAFGKKKTPTPQQQARFQGSLAHVTNYKSIMGKLLAAKEGGIHPLVAMGSGTSSGPSIQLESKTSSFDPSEMGQGIDRIIQNSRSKQQNALDNLTLEKAKLENEYLKTQIAGSAQAVARSAQAPTPNSNPSMVGQGNSPDNSNTRKPPASAQYRNYNGSTSLLTSKDASEAYEALGVLGQGDFLVRNYLPYEASKAGRFLMDKTSPPLRRFYKKRGVKNFYKKYRKYYPGKFSK